MTQATPYVKMLVMVEREVLKEERIPFEKKVKKDNEVSKRANSLLNKWVTMAIQAFTYTVSETNGKKSVKRS